MPQFEPDRPDGDPTAAEIFRVFRNTTMASIGGLRLLLEECANLRAELITIHGMRSDGHGDGAFSARQQSRILELQNAAKDLEALIVSLPREASEARDGPAAPISN